MAEFNGGIRISLVGELYKLEGFIPFSKLLQFVLLRGSIDDIRKLQELPELDEEFVLSTFLHFTESYLGQLEHSEKPMWQILLLAMESTIALSKELEARLDQKDRHDQLVQQALTQEQYRVYQYMLEHNWRIKNADIPTIAGINEDELGLFLRSFRQGLKTEPAIPYTVREYASGLCYLARKRSSQAEQQDEVSTTSPA